MTRSTFLTFCLAVVFVVSPSFAANDSLGIFSDHTDIGDVKHAGSAVYNEASATYSVAGSGANMWFTQDAFHYVWKKVSGDIALSAVVSFVGTSAEPHRKACLMIRQTLDADSPYVDVAVHGDGLTSLQFREQKGGVTKEVQTSTVGPRRLRIDKIGATAYMSLAIGDAPISPSGCSVRLPFEDSFYIGIGVCAHQADKIETAVFSEVQLSPPSSDVTAIRSSLETIVIASTDRRSVYHSKDVIAAPNWTRDGRALIFNSGGRLYRYELTGAKEPERIDTGFAVNCSNHHGLSPDGTQLVISDSTKTGKSRIYTLPVSGGTPVEITPNEPSYWHGWSPDGTTLTYRAERDGKSGIFVIPAKGGVETRLTTASRVDDAPEFSADGKFITFNSDRTGRMQIWRMAADGKNAEQLTRDEQNNAFPHPSPNGKWVAFISYAPDSQHYPRDRDVALRLLNVASGEVTTLAHVFGGEGTIDAPSWSSDSTKLAYVRYQPRQ